MKKSLGRIGSWMVLYRSLIVVVVVFLANRSSWSDTGPNVTNSTITSKEWKDLEGRYYRGDGLGFNQLITLHEDGRWTYRNYGCSGKQEVHLSGQGVMTSQTIVFRVTNGVLESVARTSSTNDLKYIVVVWGERLYLVEESEIWEFIGRLNRRKEPRERMHGDDFLRIGDEKKEVWSEPSIPSQYLRLLCTNEVLLSIRSVGNVEKVVEELDGERFCEYEVVFAVTNNSTMHVGMALVSRESSGKEGCRFGRVVRVDNGLVEGVCGLWEGEVQWCTNRIYTTGPGFIKRQPKGVLPTR